MHLSTDEERNITVDEFNDEQHIAATYLYLGKYPVKITVRKSDDGSVSGSIKMDGEELITFHEIASDEPLMAIVKRRLWIAQPVIDLRLSMKALFGT